MAVWLAEASACGFMAPLEAARTARRAVTITRIDETPQKETCNLFSGHGSISSKRQTMKCEELLAMLNEYVDGAVDPAICQEFEKHIAGCHPCQVVVDNIRHTITLYRGGQPYDLPLPFRRRLHAALRDNWKKLHASHS